MEANVDNFSLLTPPSNSFHSSSGLLSGTPRMGLGALLLRGDRWENAGNQLRFDRHVASIPSGSFLHIPVFPRPGPERRVPVWAGSWAGVRVWSSCR